jgi:hypothetical protein
LETEGTTVNSLNLSETESDITYSVWENGGSKLGKVHIIYKNLDYKRSFSKLYLKGQKGMALLKSYAVVKTDMDTLVLRLYFSENWSIFCQMKLKATIGRMRNS